MKIRQLILLTLMAILSGIVQAQQRYFDAAKMVETGIYYYPEAWSPDQWERDVKKMSEMGFEFVHLAEFSWAKIEPSEGKFDFSWLDQILRLVDKYHLKAIIGTPTAAPPAWLTEKYSQVLIVMPNGLTTMHGTREHYSWSSAKYRELTRKVVEAMAVRYGNDKRVWGWQIDNEPSHYGNLDYHPEAQSNFIDWLKKKYHTIERLNAAWGTDFWSGVYTSFEQIKMPNLLRLNNRPACPASLVDLKRFNADECAGYVSFQYRILKEKVSPSQFVTTNFMYLHTDVDPWRNPDLDFPSFTMYPVGGYAEGVGCEGFRIGNPCQISFAADYFRSQNGVSGVMELQPGQINGSTGFRPLTYPGVIRSWLWNCFGSGLSFVCSYRFRQPLSGWEKFHYGVIGTDGITPSTGGEEYMQFIREMKKMRTLYKANCLMPSKYAERKTALLYQADNVWETSVQAQTAQWNENEHILKYYTALKLLTVPVDVVSEQKDLTGYRMVVVPAYQMVDKALVDKWLRYATSGGNLVISCRTALTDRNGRFFETSWGGMLSDLIGGKISMYDALSPSAVAHINLDNKSFAWNNWGDILDPAPDTQTWATYADQFYAGKAAVTHHRIGKGTVTYVGVDSDDGRLEKAVLKKVFESVGLTTEPLPDGVVLNWRDGFWVANNYSSVAVTLHLAAGDTIIAGTKTIPPAGVLVWK